MNFENFIKLTEASFDFDKVKRKERAGMSGARAYGSDSGNVGMSDFEKDRMSSDITAEEDGDRFYKIKKTLIDAIKLLPEYGLVSEESPEWELFLKTVKDKIDSPVIKGVEAEAVEEGLAPWVASLKDLERNPNKNRGGENKGGKEFMARILKDKLNLSSINRQPLRILNSINAAGKLFPEKKNFGKFDGGYINKGPGQEEDRDRARMRGAEVEGGEDFIQLGKVKLHSNFIKRIKDAFGDEADDYLFDLIKKAIRRGYISPNDEEKLKEKARRLGL